MKKTLLVSVIFSILIICSCKDNTERQISVIIPQPELQTMSEGSFSFSENTVLTLDKSAKIYESQIKQWFNKLPVRQATGKESRDIVKIILDTTQTIKQDAYRLIISSQTIEIEASSLSGVFYAIQSLQQLYNFNKKIPCQTIEDSPRFPYRGLLFDVSCYYFDIEFIKKQIDAMSYYKMNKFLWYITGDGGWRIEIPQYPWLSEKAGWRTEKNYAKWIKSEEGFCSSNTNKCYGGTYSPKEIKHLVEYAQNRFVEVIPVIEIPCFSERLKETYSEHLPCSEVSAGKEDSQAIMLNNIVDEVVKLFSAKTIYIGNGETSGSRTTECVSCLPRVAVGSEIESQTPKNRLLHSIQNHLKKKNIQLIIWESSVRANIDTSKTMVVAWHETEEAMKAAELGYNVIVASAPNFSLDYYQSNPTTEPVGMSGFLPLESVYQFNPISTSYKELSNQIKGIQANMWTAYSENAEQVEYMLYPRLLAVSEVAWSYPSRKSYIDFRHRIQHAYRHLQSANYNYFDIREESLIRPGTDITLNSIAKHKPVKYFSMYDERFPGGSTSTLTDGEQGGWSYQDGRWQGFQGIDFDVMVDLGESTSVTEISATFISDPIGNIYTPFAVQIMISDDGENYQLLSGINNPSKNIEEGYKLIPFAWRGNTKSRYIRYIGKYNGPSNGWIFTDELIIN